MIPLIMGYTRKKLRQLYMHGISPIHIQRILSYLFVLFTTLLASQITVFYH